MNNILDNECVLECSDTMHTSPTWVATPVGSDLWNGYNASLSGSDGYCCTGTPGEYGPLCGTEQGCYIQLGIERDPLCEFGSAVSFDSAANQCNLGQNVCDTSALVGGVPQSYTELGCNNILGTVDDYWGVYDNDCVYEDPTQPHVYDLVCCYDYSIAGFDVYSDNLPNSIVVY